MGIVSTIKTRIVGWTAAGEEKTIRVNDDGELVLANDVISLTAEPLSVVSANFTRPNTTTQYAINDEVSNDATAGSVVPLHFDNIVAANGDTGYIVKASLKVTGIPATASVTGALFRLYLFQTPMTPVGDNVVFPLLGADLADAECYIDFAMLTAGTGSTAMYGLDDGLRTPFKVDAASRDLYGLLIAMGTYTPTAQSVWTVRLFAELAG